MPLQNIIILNDFAHINGGAAQVAITSAIGLAARGYRVFYFCAVPPVDPKLAEDPNIQVISTGQKDILNNPNRVDAFVQGLWNQKSAAELGHLVQNLPASKTVVHVHGWTKALSPSLFPVLQSASYPTVVSLHDYFVACPNGGFYNYPRQKICTLTPLSLKCTATNCDVRSYPQKLWRIARGVAQKHVAHLPSGISEYIVASEMTEQILTPFLPADARIYRVPNPIDAPRQERVRAEINRTYTVVGRLSPEKGFDLAARAARRLGLSLEIIGNGPEIDAIRSLHPEAIFTGWLSREAMFDRLQHARTILFPSRLYETQGLVVSEAAALGIPAIVSDRTAASELIVERQNGLLFTSGDTESLIEKLSITEDDFLLQQMSQNAYEYYWANPLTIELHINQLLEVYGQVLHHQTTR